MNLDKEELTDEEIENTIKEACEKNDVNFNSLKVVEECLELAEVLTKRVTKVEYLQPPIEDVIEEIGDLMTRLIILAEQLEITEEMSERCMNNLAFIKKNMDAGNFGLTVTVTKRNK